MNFIKNLKIKNVVLYSFLIAFTCIQVYPIIWMVLFSLKTNNEFYNSSAFSLPQSFRWQNYVDALTTGNMALYFLNSIVITAISIFAIVMLGSMAAFAISRIKWKLSNATLMLYLIGVMIPIHATIIPLFIILSKLKILNTPQAVILPYIAFGLSTSVYILVGAMSQIPKALEESAVVDGASIYWVFSVIALPLIRPAMITVIILNYLAVWNEYIFAATFLGGKFKPLMVGIMYFVGRYSTEWGAMGAALVIATLPTLVIYGFLNKQITKGITAGAVKG